MTDKGVSPLHCREIQEEERPYYAVCSYAVGCKKNVPVVVYCICGVSLSSATELLVQLLYCVLLYFDDVKHLLALLYNTILSATCSSTNVTTLSEMYLHNVS